MTETTGLAFAAGMLATVSPCGIAMLPGFLAYYIGTDASASGRAGGRTEVLRRSVQGLRTGVVVSAGFVAVFTVTALIVTAGLRSVVEAVPWLAVAVGVVLVAVGVLLLAGRRVAVTLRFNPLRQGGRGPKSMLAYGAAYAVASLSCSLGVLLALIGGGLTASNATNLLGVFAAFAAGSSTILILLALSAALASGGLTTLLQRSSRYASQVAGGIVLLSGVYMVAYWVPALDGGSSNRGLADIVMPATAGFRDFFEAHTGSLGFIAVTMVVLISAWVLWSHRTGQSTVLDQHDDATSDDELSKSR